VRRARFVADLIITQRSKNVYENRIRPEIIGVIDWIGSPQTAEIAQTTKAFWGRNSPKRLAINDKGFGERKTLRTQTSCSPQYLKNTQNQKLILANWPAQAKHASRHAGRREDHRDRAVSAVGAISAREAGPW